jgi:hypothetical protein
MIIRLIIGRLPTQNPMSDKAKKEIQIRRRREPPFKRKTVVKKTLLEQMDQWRIILIYLKEMRKN